MGEQRGFAEGRLARFRHHFGRHAGQFTEQILCLRQGERHQRRARRNDLQPELLAQLVGKTRCAKLGNRRPAGGDHQVRRAVNAGTGGDGEAAISMAHIADRGPKGEIHTASGAFVHQHGNNLFRRTIAEQLPQRLFVEGDIVAAHQINEIGWRVARQSGTGEVLVLAQIPIRHCANIGEIAATAAGNQDLLARFLVVIDHQHPRAHLPGG